MAFWVKAPMPGGDLGMAQVCALAASPPQAGASDELKAWAKVPERPGFPGGQAYVFTVDGGRHQALPPNVDAAFMKAAFASGRLHFAMGRADAQATMLLLFISAR
jgi:hypothetical protein